MTEPQNPSSFTHSSPQPQPLRPPKKKRSLPGMPDPDAEVIALSPKTLLATNRFVCEICNKGFQRDQNLQLHRRGHDLPWKLLKRGSKEPRKKVYVCPERSCVHHNAARALGDLTGIKKHFCRKHGQKKWKCERCSKKYALHSDWKAHMKTCLTREYRCDCGTLLSRDSFITHRAFCDVLAQESARAQVEAEVQAQAQGVSNGNVIVASSPPTPPLTPSPSPSPSPSASMVSPTFSIQSSEIPENSTKQSLTSPKTQYLVRSSSTPSSSTTCTTVFASALASSSTATSSQSQSPSTSSFSNLMPNMREPTSLSLSTPLFLSNNDPPHYTASSTQPALSATALLQRAAQMGSSSASLFRGLATPSNATTTRGQVKQENHPVVDNLGLGLPCGTGSVTDVMMGQPMTRDLLGLSIGVGGSLSTLLTSFPGNFDSSGDDGGLHRYKTGNC